MRCIICDQEIERKHDNARICEQCMDVLPYSVKKNINSFSDKEIKTMSRCFAKRRNIAMGYCIGKFGLSDSTVVIGGTNIPFNYVQEDQL